jgi:hypothetical protein
MDESAEIGLAAVLEALSPYADDLMLVGGWVPYLYARNLEASQWAGLLTRDIDLAVPRRLVVRGQTIDALLKEIDLEDAFRSVDRPPLVKYVGSIAGTVVEVEFLTTEKGNREGVKVVQSGLHATALHYVDVLLDHPFRMNVSLAGRLVQVVVPSPAAFLLQKGLVFPRRRMRDKKAKDLYCVFDVWRSCTPWRSWIIEQLGESIRAEKPQYLAKCADNLARHCSDVSGDGVRMLAEQRPPTVLAEMDDDQFSQYAWGVMEEVRRLLTGK